MLSTVDSKFIAVTNCAFNTPTASVMMLQKMRRMKMMMSKKKMMIIIQLIPSAYLPPHISSSSVSLRLNESFLYTVKSAFYPTDHARNYNHVYHVVLSLHNHSVSLSLWSQASAIFFYI